LPAVIGKAQVVATVSCIQQPCAVDANHVLLLLLRPYAVPCLSASAGDSSSPTYIPGSHLWLLLCPGMHPSLNAAVQGEQAGAAHTSRQAQHAREDASAPGSAMCAYLCRQTPRCRAWCTAWAIICTCPGSTAPQIDAGAGSAASTSPLLESSCLLCLPQQK
jgi:hypothetical protein